MKLQKLVLLSIASFAIPVSAEVRLPAIISDHMVLQRSKQVPIWGFADPGEDVRVVMGETKIETTTRPDGRWRVDLDLTDAPTGPHILTISGNNTVTLNDVIVGEVWLASGQSNMEWRLINTTNAATTIAESGNPLIRQFQVIPKPAFEPASELQGRWVLASPETTGAFSAVAYYFARALNAELNVPVGIINASWGGTPSEAWTSVPAIDSVPNYQPTRERMWKVALDYQKQKPIFNAAMDQWIQEHAREDRQSEHRAEFTADSVSSDGWVPVVIPGPVTASGLPETGAIWLRTEVEITSHSSPSLPLSLPINGFDEVCWNGKLVKKITPTDYPGDQYIRRYGPYDIPARDIRNGTNILAIRLYQPVGPATIFDMPKAGGRPLDGPWLAKAEFALPALTPEEIASAPKPPKYFSGAQNIPGTLFNGMIHPLIPYAIAGVIWYQGESNVGRAYEYRRAFPLLISDWRQHWHQGEFPFYFVQLAGYLPKKEVPGDSLWAELREAQNLTLSLPNTGQAVTFDLGESEDIHPRNKKDVGERLARIALAKDYGKSDLASSGPVFTGMEIVNGKVILSFDSTDGGLIAKELPATYDVVTAAGTTSPLVRNSPSSQLEGFAICGDDRVWKWAQAKIDGDRVVVWSDAVPEPIAVRYAWQENPTANLYNGAGLPASPFRTDDFDPLSKNVTF